MHTKNNSDRRQFVKNILYNYYFNNMETSKFNYYYLQNNLLNWNFVLHFQILFIKTEYIINF